MHGQQQLDPDWPSARNIPVLADSHQQCRAHSRVVLLSNTSLHNAAVKWAVPEYQIQEDSEPTTNHLAATDAQHRDRGNQDSHASGNDPAAFREEDSCPLNPNFSVWESQKRAEAVGS